MKSLSRKLEALFSAVAFADEGEFDTAREIMAEADCREDNVGRAPDKGIRMDMPATES